MDRLTIACAAGVLAALIALPQASAQGSESSIEGVWRVFQHGIRC